MDEVREERSEVERRPASTPLARQAGASVTVYAAVTGLAGAVPVPLLDAMLSELSRGAAMRRVARRHGVRLTPDARAVLSSAGSIHATSTERGRLVKAALSSVLAPFRVAARLEDALGTMLAAVLLDHFLRRPERPNGATLTEPEARRIRAATEAAVAEGGFDAIKTIPAGLWAILREAFGSLVSADPEGRSPVERFVDAILDGFADAPTDLIDNLSHHFDRAMAEDGGTP
ncbi:MAG TPA: hypothetical protein RMH99_20305 [Sandaracinaceae bacterium LLY-WYZ-13_1]|nr:hypothetical protein [Sandaracinaceae bacterium LLY-WYZ-13_1]